MKLGLIAGNGRFPFLVLEAARAQDHQVTVIATKEEAFTDLEDAARACGAAIHWISIGQLGTCIKLLKDAGASHAVMAGQVKHAQIFAGGIRPDATFLGLLARLPFRNTDGLIGAVAGLLRENGIELIDSTALLRPMLATAGVMTRRGPRRRSVRISISATRWPMQSPGSTSARRLPSNTRPWVAVEAMEGTDEVIGRAGHLAGPGVRIVKVAKPNQDMRFDVPVVGLATIQAMRVAGASALSIDAGRTLMFERETMIASADEAGITIVEENGIDESAN